MKKSFKAFVKNAMVYALAVSMLVSTPITASASGLNGVFSISDGKDTWNYDENGNKEYTSTGTNTVTNTNTKPLDDETEAKVIGLVLDKDNITTSVGKKPKLTATIVYDGDVDPESEQAIKLNNQIRWEITEPKGGTTSLSIKVEDGKRTECTLNPIHGGKFEVTASILDTDYKANATVAVNEYATGIDLIVPDAQKVQYVKHTLDMTPFVFLDPETATDEITWSISTSVRNSATISNAGVVTFKKVDEVKEDGTGGVTVTAVTEMGKIASAKISVEAGTPATSVEIHTTDKKGGSVTNMSKKTRAMDIGTDDPENSLTVTAVMENKVKKNGVTTIIRTDDANYTDGAITDVITWSSNKEKIVEVKGDGLEATLTPLAVGTAKITAKATSGKSTFINVKVSATLTGLKITNTETLKYSGQTLQMTVKRTPEANKDGLKWSVEKVKYKKSNGQEKEKANPNASINGKGVLTIKNLIQSDEEYDWLKVVVKVESKKTKYPEGDEEAGKFIYDTYEITVKQSSIKTITVEDGKLPVVSVGLKANEKQEYTKKDDGKQTVYVPKTKVYTGKAESAMDGFSNEDATASLKWTSSKPKVAEVDQNGNVKALKNGSTNITVSGINIKTNGKAQVIKATYKVTVKQPAISIKLNNTSVVKAIAIKADGTINNSKKQTVSYKATQGPSGAADKITWSEIGNATLKNAEGKSNTLTIAQASYDFGNEFKVTARAASGVAATATVQILKKTYSLAIYNAETGAIFKDIKPKKTAETNNYQLLNVGDSIEMQPMVQLVKSGEFYKADEDNTEYVTYSMNKSGIVKIIDNKVYAVKAGTVKITAKTPSGKKAILTVQVQ